MPGRDTRTRFDGVYARHKSGCVGARRCSCRPSYYGVVWDRAAGKQRRTARFPSAGEARNARADLIDSIRVGAVAPATTASLADAHDQFIRAAADGIALNKWGRPYRRRAVEDLDSALRQLPPSLAARRIDAVRRGDVQRLVDQKVAAGLSGSRIRSIVNALRSLYRWAADRELVDLDPAARVRLPAMAAEPRDRVATPSEFTALLEPLALADALPFALAAYGTARHQEIRVLDWRHVDLALGAIELAADEEGRKPGGSWRVVPLVAPLRALLRHAWIAQGRPASGKVCPPRTASRSGLLSLGHLQQRVHEHWRRLGLKPIGLHEARHTAATWLDHAGVSPKVASQLMGHKTPDYQAGAAPITLRRYTHTLPGELERARDLLDAFLVERAPAEATST